ncbi:MAG: hypothetical protein ACTHNW_22225 [Mucilaginibacter sp.]
MTTTQSKRIGRRPENKGTYLTRENWEVMKPFVVFGAQALAAIGSVAWAIIKLAPKLLRGPSKPPQRGDLKKYRPL